MSSELRQRIFLFARVAAGLLAVVFLFTVVDRAGGAHKSTAVPTPSATHAVATPTNAVPTSTLPAAVPATTLCQAVPTLVQFAVQTLYLPLPDHGINVSNSVIVNQPAPTQALARQLCALPPEPARSASCAAPAGHWTQFIFAAASNEYWTVWADSGGCMAVLGVGTQTRTATPDKRLWATVVADVRHGVPLGSPVG
jgi:hypothetical protein